MTGDQKERTNTVKITEVIPHVLIGKTAPYSTWASDFVDVRYSMVVEIRTDEGITGWGESVCHGRQPGGVSAAYINYTFKPLLIGKDPFDVEVLWENMFHTSRPFGGGGAVNAISGIDVALWDIIGKALKKPIHQLIGGAFRTKVIPYATSFYRVEGRSYPEAYIEEARELIADGFRAFKLKTGYGIRKDSEYIHAMREAIGPDMLLAADANCAYDAPLTRQLLLEVEDARLHFLEEPMKTDDLEGYKMLRNKTTTHLACGENLFTKYDFRRWIVEGAVDILQPDVCSAGGITECKKIAAMAQAYAARVIPHVWGTGIGLAAALQLIAALPSNQLSSFAEEPMLEFDRSAHPFRDAVIHDKITMEDGAVKVPMGPGIGVEVNEDAVREFEQRLKQ